MWIVQSQPATYLQYLPIPNRNDVCTYLLYLCLQLPTLFTSKKEERPLTIPVLDAASFEGFLISAP